MRSLFVCAILLLTVSTAWAGPYPAPPRPPRPRSQSSSFDPAELEHDLKGAAIGGVLGAGMGWLSWSAKHDAGTATCSKRVAIATGVVGGMFAGAFIAAFSAPNSPDSNRAPVVAPRIAVRSNTSLQPVIARRGGAAIVRLRF